MAPRLLLCVGLVFSFAVSAADICAKATVVVGKVTLGGERVHPGTVIEKNDTVKTAEDGGVKFILVDESIIDLGPSTTFRFNQCRGKNLNSKIDLELSLGSVRAAVNKQPKKPRENFNIRTRSSVLAVRGTELFASWVQDVEGNVQEQVGVTEGRVEIISQFNPTASPVQIEGGQQFQAQAEIRHDGGQSVVAPVAPPKVDQFTASEQKQFEAGTKIQDPVFQNAIELPPLPPAQGEKPKGQETAGFVFEALTGEKRHSEPKPENAGAPGDLIVPPPTSNTAAARGLANEAPKNGTTAPPSAAATQPPSPGAQPPAANTAMAPRTPMPATATGTPPPLLAVNTPLLPPPPPMMGSALDPSIVPISTAQPGLIGVPTIPGTSTGTTVPGSTGIISTPPIITLEISVGRAP